MKFKSRIVYLFIVMVALLSSRIQAQENQLPNILWITSEDNSPYLGCYGDTFATTPNLDKLASEGFLYSHAFVNNPVCSPSRNTIITGVYAASNGNEHMRSTYPKSEKIKTYPELLRKAGYYCTNNSKTDLNYKGDYNSIWDESSNKAHYKNRPPGKPFFAIFNLFETHESQIHQPIPDAELRHKPENVKLPPYHPDTKEMRHDWAQYYDKMEDMDKRVGELLKELKDSGEAENTIVFYYSDHGGVLARSKRYLYETGTRVPFIVGIPERFKKYYPAAEPGSTIDRLISFVDLAPTLLSLTGIPKPEYMQGLAFLGDRVEPGPQYVHMTRGRMDERIDLSRSVRDKKYRYIRNYMPFRIYMQHLAYLFNAPSAQSWEDYYTAGKCNDWQRVPFQTKPVEELYDTENDPYELKNLVNDPAYKKVLDRMREENVRWMKEIKDTGLIPENEFVKRIGTGSMYDYMRSKECPLDELVQAAELATTAYDGNIERYTKYLGHSHSAIRYWGATGLLIHVNNAKAALPELKKASDEETSATATLIAETLFQLGEKEIASKIYTRILTGTDYGLSDKNFVLNSIDAINFRTPEIERAIKHNYESKIKSMTGFARYDVYDGLMSEYLLRKWKVINK